MCVSRSADQWSRDASAASNAVRTARVWSATPAVIRMHPAHPGCVDRSRISTPLAATSRTISAAAGPTRIKTKFASLGQYCRDRAEQKS